nr:hypothetical protein BACY1_21180 [Tenacibaculum mesophilum]
MNKEIIELLSSLIIIKIEVLNNKKALLKLVRLIVIATGFEPVTVCLEGISHITYKKL